ncbi:MAG: prolyl-tRNA synthetase associated domain-containing protein [Lachnospiraceae bacterium]
MEHRLTKGRPVNMQGRLEKEVRTYDFLDDLQIRYEYIDHSPMATIEDCEEVDRILQIEICKNLFLCDHKKENFYLLMMPGRKRFVTREVSGQLHVPRLSFAPEQYMQEYLDITPGSVSVLGLMNDHQKHVQLLIDEAILEDKYVACHPCVNTSSVKIETSSLLETILPAMEHAPILLKM